MHARAISFVEERYYADLSAAFAESAASAGNLSGGKNLERKLAREFNATFRPEENSIWARGYFAKSSGKVNLARAEAYVESQASHHEYRDEWSKQLSYRNPAFKSPIFNLDHSVCMLDYHLVLTTSQRKAVLDETIAPELFAYIGKVGSKNGFAVERMGLVPDHVHLIIETMPNVSIRQCVLALLNNTQQWMVKRYSGVLKQTDAWDVWQPSYYAGTVGNYSTAQVKRFLGRN
jgi:REP-associated tyrosine transposase